MDVAEFVNAEQIASAEVPEGASNTLYWKNRVEGKSKDVRVSLLEHIFDDLAACGLRIPVVAAGTHSALPVHGRNE